MLSMLLAVQLGAQSSAPKTDFSITVERIGCLGRCPDYTVSILSDGSVRYIGRAYVRVEGIRRKKIRTSYVEKLREKLVNEEFFNWEENTKVCVDLPEVKISATMGKQRKQVIEGCNLPGKVLRLADEVDKISGAREWVGTRP